jgi:CheY-like chemotaxis protein
VVDDDDLLLAVLQQAFEFDGQEVRLASHGIEALECVADWSPDIILLDLRMPRMDGPSFAQAYHARPGSHAPIIMFTAGCTDLVPTAALHAVAVVQKPFDLEELLAVLDRYGLAKAAC